MKLHRNARPCPNRPCPDRPAGDRGGLDAHAGGRRSERADRAQVGSRGGGGRAAQGPLLAPPPQPHPAGYRPVRARWLRRLPMTAAQIAEIRGLRSRRLALA
jgi:hypothetical protein